MVARLLSRSPRGASASRARSAVQHELAADTSRDVSSCTTAAEGHPDCWAARTAAATRSASGAAPAFIRRMRRWNTALLCAALVGGAGPSQRRSGSVAGEEGGGACLAGMLLKQCDNASDHGMVCCMLDLCSAARSL